MNASESIRHWNVEPGSELKVNCGGVRVGPVGAALAEVSGAMLSTMKVWLAGVGSVEPSESVARTRNVWSPWERSV